VSADAPAKRQVGAEAFAAWMREHAEYLFISTVTIAEIEAGSARADRIGATTKAERLRRWLSASFLCRAHLVVRDRGSPTGRSNPRSGAST
jgi:hypothetical protein